MKVFFVSDVHEITFNLIPRSSMVTELSRWLQINFRFANNILSIIKIISNLIKLDCTHIRRLVQHSDCKKYH